jgi:DNA-directed RNA polymerase specialized sigma24 family protein
MDTLLRTNVPPDVADDLAQSMTLVLVRRIEEGAVAEGSEDAYVRAAARNRARDYHREQSGVRARSTLCDAIDDLAGAEDSIEECLVDREEALERERTAARLRALVHQAPERYRAVLVHVYVLGQPIETLTVLELARRCVSPDDRDQHRRARAAVDKVLQRARDWLRERLMGLGCAL